MWYKKNDDKRCIMKSVNKPKFPQKGAGSRLREISKVRREGLKPSKELVEILQTPTKDDNHKKSARPNKDLEI